MSKMDLIICGHVGKNVSYADVDGKQVCNFSVAHSVGKDEDKKVVWIEFAAWGNKAAICEAIELQTGDKVTVYSGWVTPDAYTNNDGKVIPKIKAVVDHIEK